MYDALYFFQYNLGIITYSGTILYPYIAKRQFLFFLHSKYLAYWYEEPKLPQKCTSKSHIYSKLNDQYNLGSTFLSNHVSHSSSVLTLYTIYVTLLIFSQIHHEVFKSIFWYSVHHCNILVPILYLWEYYEVNQTWFHIIKIIIKIKMIAIKSV